jgi:hypothetical protein
MLTAQKCNSTLSNDGPIQITPLAVGLGVRGKQSSSDAFLLIWSIIVVVKQAGKTAWIPSRVSSTTFSWAGWLISQSLFDRLKSTLHLLP